MTPCTMRDMCPLSSSVLNSLLLIILQFFFFESLHSRHHHVESVHLTVTSGWPLDRALAVVRTPSREYYILSGNGLEVGCEEEGVASVWMRVLGCDARGEPDGRAGVSFEELRAYIQNL